MTWLKEKSGWLVAIAVAGLLCYFWGKSTCPNLKSQSVMLVDSSKTPVQPVFIHDTTIIERVGGSMTKVVRETVSTPAETVYRASSPTKPCEAFSLHLTSSDSVPAAFGLDSVSVSYRWPLGDYFFAYWGHPQKAGLNNAKILHDILSTGFSIGYLRYQNNIYGTAYLRLNLFGLNGKTGYHHETDRQLSWFLEFGKEWKIF